ncbi:MAG TPA: 2-C-methyl-D-erythritol 2,4-cyclodiphosphate synthase, partial [Bacteroidia bacterium]|jgi:2-C-methyl-D-erythritol 2,4-cyclodiphosphate synthase|nr:2-C-methyl-D-erythritol 2,4-cyclodiphosphate synthase [Bacteroidia bacterium]
MNIRVGFGFDVHPLAEGKELWLGGLKIPHTKGCVGHSDADVLLHAICDALLGAAGLRDIGHYFPNTDAKYKGVDSKILLAETVRLVKEKGYKIGNIDSTLCIEEPKINPHIAAMKKILAPILEIAEEDISIKATTNERLGYVGSENGVNAYAVVLISK